MKKILQVAEKTLSLHSRLGKVSARMVKLVDTLVSGTSGRKAVQVRVLFRAQKKRESTDSRFFCAQAGAFSDPTPSPFRGRGVCRKAPVESTDSRFFCAQAAPFQTHPPAPSEEGEYVARLRWNLLILNIYHNGSNSRDSVPVWKDSENGLHFRTLVMPRLAMLTGMDGNQNRVETGSNCRQEHTRCLYCFNYELFRKSPWSFRPEKTDRKDQRLSVCCCIIDDCKMRVRS